MANKRMLKKGIIAVCGDLAGISLFSEAGEKLSGKEISEIVIELACAQENAVKNVSISFDKTPKDFENKKEYNKARRSYFKIAYRTLIDQLNEKLQEVLKRINAAA